MAYLNKTGPAPRQRQTDNVQPKTPRDGGDLAVRLGSGTQTEKTSTQIGSEYANHMSKSFDMTSSVKAAPIKLGFLDVKYEVEAGIVEYSDFPPPDVVLRAWDRKDSVIQSLFSKAANIRLDHPILSALSREEWLRNRGQHSRRLSFSPEAVARTWSQIVNNGPQSFSSLSSGAQCPYGSVWHIKENEAEESELELAGLSFRPEPSGLSYINTVLNGRQLEISDCNELRTRQEWRAIGIDPPLPKNLKFLCIIIEAAEEGLRLINKPPVTSSKNKENLGEAIRKLDTSYNTETRHSGDIIMLNADLKIEFGGCKDGADQSGHYASTLNRQTGRLEISACYKYRDLSIQHTNHYAAFPAWPHNISASLIIEGLLQNYSKSPGSVSFKDISSCRMGSIAGTGADVHRAVRALFPGQNRFTIHRPRDDDRTSKEAIAYFALMGVSNSTIPHFLAQSRGMYISEIMVDGGLSYTFDKVY